MKLGKLYDSIIKKGIEKDPRTPKEIREELAKAAKEFKKLSRFERNRFDMDRLRNPYSDTRILYGDPESQVKTVMAGIDMEGPEILLADRLNRGGASIDLVLTHHPEGAAWSRLHDVMKIQAFQLKKLGIPFDIANDILKERMDEVRRSISAANHSRSVDIARLLDIPYMCVHTPADNHVADYLQRLFDKSRPKKLSQIIKTLNAIPEYADAIKKDAGPRLLAGDPDKDPGKIFVDMTGGTEGPKRIFPRLSQAGVGTIIAMHLSEAHFKMAKSEFVNIVIAGHIASDNFGLNLILDEIEKTEKLKIIPCSGFLRVKR